METGINPEDLERFENELGRNSQLRSEVVGSIEDLANELDYDKVIGTPKTDEDTRSLNNELVHYMRNHNFTTREPDKLENELEEYARLDDKAADFLEDLANEWEWKRDTGIPKNDEEMKSLDEIICQLRNRSRTVREGDGTDEE